MNTVEIFFVILVLTGIGMTILYRKDATEINWYHAVVLYTVPAIVYLILFSSITICADMLRPEIAKNSTYTYTLNADHNGISVKEDKEKNLFQYNIKTNEGEIEIQSHVDQVTQTGDTYKIQMYDGESEKTWINKLFFKEKPCYQLVLYTPEK